MLRAGYVLQRDTGLTICKLVQLLVLQNSCVVGHFSMIEPAVYMYHIDGTSRLESRRCGRFNGRRRRPGHPAMKPFVHVKRFERACVDLNLRSS